MLMWLYIFPFRGVLKLSMIWKVSLLQPYWIHVLVISSLIGALANPFCQWKEWPHWCTYVANPGFNFVEFINSFVSFGVPVALNTDGCLWMGSSSALCLSHTQPALYHCTLVLLSLNIVMRRSSPVCSRSIPCDVFPPPVVWFTDLIQLYECDLYWYRVSVRL